MTHKSDFITDVTLVATCSLPWIIASVTVTCQQIHMIYQMKTVFITIRITYIYS